MKNIIATIAIVALASIASFGQSNQNNDASPIQLFGGLQFDFTEYASEFDISGGGKIGLMFNNGIAAGILTDLNFLREEPRLEAGPGITLPLETIAGGLFAEYFTDPYSKHSFSFPVEVLATQTAIKDSDLDINEDNIYGSLRLGINYNWIWNNYTMVSIGAGYRWAMFSDLPSVTNTDLSGAFIGIEFKFGNWDLN